MNCLTKGERKKERRKQRDNLTCQKIYIIKKIEKVLNCLFFCKCIFVCLFYIKVVSTQSVEIFVYSIELQYFIE